MSSGLLLAVTHVVPTPPGWLEPSLDHLRDVLDANRARGCPELRIGLEVRPWTAVRYDDVVAAPVLAALVVRRDGRSTWNAHPDEDAFEVAGPLRRVLARAGGGPGRVNVVAVPDLWHYADSWQRARAVALGARDFPATLSATGAAPTVVMRVDETNPGVLTHELMHVLVDLPRHVDRGDEHSTDPGRVLARGHEHVGRTLTVRECAWIRRSPLLTTASVTTGPPARR